MIFVFSFLYKKICHHFEVTAEVTDLLFRQLRNLKDMHLIIIHIGIKTSLDFHQFFDFLFVFIIFAYVMCVNLFVSFPDALLSQSCFLQFGDARSQISMNELLVIQLFYYNKVSLRFQ